MAKKDNALALSDEEFMKLDPMAFEPEDVDDEDHEGQDDDNQESDQSDNDAGDDDDAQNEQDGQDGGKEDDDDDDASESDQDDSSDDDHGSDDSDKDQNDSDESDKSGDDESDSGDSADDKAPPTGELTTEQYANIGKQIMGEFKANGEVMKVKSAEDAITLMQMGANYHKKMKGLKPAMKALKLLENHGLMDPSKINFLIDLSQKKPEAITQLLKDAKVDPMDLDLQGEDTYVPDNRTVSDAELALDEVLDSISGSPAYQRTLTVLTDDWDASSRETLARDPNMIRVINGHIETGIFDQVASAVNYERSLGKLVGVNDFDAYLKIGDHMHKNNMFKAAGRQNQNANTEVDNRQQSQQSDNTAEEEARKAKKKAASPTRRNPAKESGKKESYNPLSMSDEDFAKLNKLNL